LQYKSKHRSRILEASVLAAAALWIVRGTVRRRRRLDLLGRTVLITGGSRGLGLALAREFVGRGARVAICARDSAELSRAKEMIEAPGAAVHTFVCDLTSREEIITLVQKVEAECGPIDVLVNNAGLIAVGPVENLTADDFQEAMSLNLWAAIHLTLALAPRMKANGGGRIVNIASVGGKMPVPHLAAYCTSKFALVGFSSSMRTELAKDNVLVTTVSPGLMRTGSPRNATFKGQHKAEYAWFSIGDTLGGISMSAADAARRIVSATVNGDAELVLGLPAKLGAVSYGLFPGLHTEMTELAARLFPRASSNDQKRLGRDSESWITQSLVTQQGRRAEQDYNQIKQ
jgi:short-subunit dehydrogenase